MLEGLEEKSSLSLMFGLKLDGDSWFYFFAITCFSKTFESGCNDFGVGHGIADVEDIVKKVFDEIPAFTVGFGVPDMGAIPVYDVPYPEFMILGIPRSLAQNGAVFLETVFACWNTKCVDLFMILGVHDEDREGVVENDPAGT